MVRGCGGGCAQEDWKDDTMVLRDQLCDSDAHTGASRRPQESLGCISSRG